MDPFSASSRTGLFVGGGGGEQTASITEQLGPAGANPPIWSPANPLFWFGALLGLSLGLIGISGSVKLGKAKFAASAGEA